MKNKKILAIIILVIGLLLIVLALLFNNSASTKVTDLEFKNFKLTSDNSFIIDVYNPTTSLKESSEVIINLLNNSNKVIMNVMIEVPDLNSKETKTIEYSQAGIFDEIPVNFKVKKYTGNEELKENTSLENQLSNLLIEKAKEVVEENFSNQENFNMNLTALSLKNDYHKDLSELEKKEYKCSLENSYVVVEFIDNNFNYTTYLECEIFLEK